jgi:hypothetical protein
MFFVWLFCNFVRQEYYQNLIFLVTKKSWWFFSWKKKLKLRDSGICLFRNNSRISIWKHNFIVNKLSLSFLIVNITNFSWLKFSNRFYCWTHKTHKKNYDFFLVKMEAEASRLKYLSFSKYFKYLKISLRLQKCSSA